MLGKKGGGGGTDSRNREIIYGGLLEACRLLQGRGEENGVSGAYVLKGQR